MNDCKKTKRDLKIHFARPNIAQLPLVERSTVDSADIEWSLVRFRVFGFSLGVTSKSSIHLIVLTDACFSDIECSIGLVVMTSA